MFADSVNTGHRHPVHNVGRMLQHKITMLNFSNIIYKYISLNTHDSKFKLWVTSGYGVTLDSLPFVNFHFIFAFFYLNAISVNTLDTCHASG